MRWIIRETRLLVSGQRCVGVQPPSSPARCDGLSTITATSLRLRESVQTGRRDWKGSPFAWFLERSPGTIGSVGVAMVRDWAVANGYRTGMASDSDHDLTIEGKRVEVKFSTLWDCGLYRFQQLRDQGYDFTVCLGVSPNSAHCWVIPKSDLMRMWRQTGEIRGQHGGGDASAVGWFSVKPLDPPPWTKQYGGSIDEATVSLAAAVSRCH